MSCAKIYALSQVIGFTCVGTNTLSLVAIKLGAGEVVLGLLSMMMISTLVFRVFTMSAVEKYGKKHVIILWQGIAIVCCVPFLIIPFVAEKWAKEVTLGILLVTVFARVATASMGNTGWFPFLQDIVPRRITGRFFASLRMTWQTANLITLLAISWFLGKDAAWWKFEVVFVVAILAYTVRIISMIPTTENPPKGKDAVTPKLRERFGEIFSNRKLLGLTGFVTSYWIAATMATPFKIKYLKNLDYGDGFIIAATAMISAGAVVSLWAWGKLADRFGNRSLLGLCHLGLPVVTGLWVLVGPQSHIFVLALFLGWSVFNSGAGIAMIRLLMHNIPQEKQNQINVINVIGNFFMGLAPLAAGVFISSLDGVDIRLGVTDMGHYHVFFLVSAALFAVPYFASMAVRNERESSTREMMVVVTRPLLSMVGPVVKINGRKPFEKDSKRS
ncbi:sugar (Glycoside-Pentoside-Hexuronide) transporter [Anaerohalosphaera lusitana]|uniref:Sugar (Glycoside-Pentoside-Hexuronide) transporter n=2 Tax=Anaerohalosphaera lusitana TaxID=1936003 RepID=A0A1U9NQC5_9BACT|nr:sugar (Glycoside-Pentoside-Hexuronide) transporter [Anaerohalosphaera lusitana]